MEGASPDNHGGLKQMFYLSAVLMSVEFTREACHGQAYPTLWLQRQKRHFLPNYLDLLIIKWRCECTAPSLAYTIDYPLVRCGGSSAFFGPFRHRLVNLPHLPGRTDCII